MLEIVNQPLENSRIRLNNITIEQADLKKKIGYMTSQQKVAFEIYHTEQSEWFSKSQLLTPKDQLREEVKNVVTNLFYSYAKDNKLDAEGVAKIFQIATNLSYISAHDSKVQ